MHLEIYI